MTVSGVGWCFPIPILGLAKTPPLPRQRERGRDQCHHCSAKQRGSYIQLIYRRLTPYQNGGLSLFCTPLEICSCELLEFRMLESSLTAHLCLLGRWRSVAMVTSIPFPKGRWEVGHGLLPSFSMELDEHGHGHPHPICLMHFLVGVQGCFGTWLLSFFRGHGNPHSKSRGRMVEVVPFAIQLLYETHRPNRDRALYTSHIEKTHPLSEWGPVSFLHSSYIHLI